jgi:hypothetical protein
LFVPFVSLDGLICDAVVADACDGRVSRFPDPEVVGVRMGENIESAETGRVACAMERTEFCSEIKKIRMTGRKKN